MLYKCAIISGLICICDYIAIFGVCYNNPITTLCVWLSNPTPQKRRFHQCGKGMESRHSKEACYIRDQQWQEEQSGPCKSTTAKVSTSRNQSNVFHHGLTGLGPTGSHRRLASLRKNQTQQTFEDTLNTSDNHQIDKTWGRVQSRQDECCVLSRIPFTFEFMTLSFKWITVIDF